MGYPEWKSRNFPTATAFVESETVDPSAASGLYQQATFLWTLFVVFLGGMALNLTPCVYPLIPITVSYFGGRAGLTRGRIALHGICYIGGLAIVNSLLGVTAALTGGMMGALLQNSWVLIGIALILVILAASLFGLWELRMPFWLTQAASRSYTGYVGSIFMGLTLGIIAAPCIGPFVLGLLTWVAGTGSPAIGFLVFFMLSLGLGCPLFLLALFSGHIDKLPRSGEWMLWIRRLMGWVLVGMAVYFIGPVLPVGWSKIAMALVAVAAGLHLGWIDRTQASSAHFARVKVIIGTTCLVFALVTGAAVLLKGPGVDWHGYSSELLNDAVLQGKPVIMDFYADWCAPCRELEDITFHDPAIVKIAESEVIMVKIDLTRKDAKTYDHLLKKYDIKGVPTVVFIGKDGLEQMNLRIVDFEPPEQVLLKIAQLQAD